MLEIGRGGECSESEEEEAEAAVKATTGGVPAGGTAVSGKEGVGDGCVRVRERLREARAGGRLDPSTKVPGLLRVDLEASLGSTEANNLNGVASVSRVRGTFGGVSR